MALQALIFDVDGTLADTERDGHRVAFNRAFAAMGLDWFWSETLYNELLTVTGGKERIRHYVANYHPDFKAAADFAERVARLHAAKTDAYVALLAEGRIPLRPGVLRLLTEARAQGVRLAIATTTTEANVLALLQHALGTSARSWFEVIAAGDIVAAKKPAPDIYYYVLDRLRLGADACMAFEDSENGLRAARAAGIKTVVTVNDYTQGHCFDGATIVLDHLGDVGNDCRVLAPTVLNGFALLDMSSLRKLHSDQRVLD